MKAMKTNSRRTVGHLPVEISRATKFLPDLGAKVIVTLTETHCRRSPLVQIVLEIPWLLVAKMNGYSVRSQMLLQKYLELASDLYAETKNEEILGSFVVLCIESNWSKTNSNRFKKKGKNSKAKYNYTGNWY